MRILVGTLYTIENEFDDCVAAINRQTHHGFEHFIVRGLPNKAAHDKLYRHFMSRAEDFDLFIKVDADMVLADDRFFEYVVTRFNEEAYDTVEALIVSVHDWFSNRLIEGLHVYRSRVRWRLHDERVFVDRASVDPRCIRYDRDDLAPAAYHSPDPTDFQAFHFGVHKGVKVRAAVRGSRMGTARFHMDNIEQTWRHFLEAGDRRLGWASLGAELALRGRFEPDHVDYHDPYTRQVMDRYAGHDSAALRGLVARWRRRSGAWLGPMRRAEMMTDGPARFVARRMVPRGLHPMVAKVVGGRSSKPEMDEEPAG